MEEKSVPKEDGGDNLSATISSILSNPEMLSMITSMASTLKGESTTKEEKAPEEAPSEVEASLTTPTPDKKLPEMLATIAPLLSHSGPRSDDKRAHLLLALKPYLSSGRCEAIDYIIKFSNLSEILKNLS